MQSLIDKLATLNNLDIKIVPLDGQEGETLSVRFLKDISEEDTIEALKSIFDWELAIGDFKVDDKDFTGRPVVNLSLKGINYPALREAFRYSFNRIDMRNPFMLMNVFNFIKTYNTLTDKFLKSPEVFLNDLEQSTDLKIELKSEIIELKKKTSIYFLSTLKSYNKLEYTDKDNYPVLPNMFKAFFNSSDLLTLCGIFADSPTFDTKELVKVHNAFEYVTSMLEKSAVGFGLMEGFLNLMEEKGKIKDKEKETDDN